MKLRKPLVVTVEGAQVRFEKGSDVDSALLTPKAIEMFIKSGHIDPSSVPSAKDVAEAQKARRKAELAKSQAEKEAKEAAEAKAAAELAEKNAEKEAKEAEAAAKAASEAAKEAAEAEEVLSDSETSSKRGRKKKN